MFKPREDLGVVAEYLNPSFVVKKRSGGFQLVTAFTDFGRYSKPQPSLMPDVNSTLQKIACWHYVIVSDLSQSFYQIPLSKNSLKYCSVTTPFKGVRVYARCTMGMPSSETALEELMCRVLSDLLQNGCAAKIADCDLHLSAQKTIIAAVSTMILSWIWSAGSIHTSPHRAAALGSRPLPKNSLRPSCFHWLLQDAQSRYQRFCCPP